MKKGSILLGVILALGLMVLPVGAQRGEQPVRVQEIREAQQERREEIKERNQTRREEFKVKLATMAAERKSKIAERVNTQLNHINQVVTDHFLRMVERLRALLAKLAQRVEKFGGSSSVEAAKGR